MKASAKVSVMQFIKPRENNGCLCIGYIIMGIINEFSHRKIIRNIACLDVDRADYFSLFNRRRKINCAL